MTTTEAIELGGVIAVVAVAAVGWFLAWNVRRPKIRFSVGRRVLVAPNGSNEEIIAVNVLNRGSLPIHIVSVGMRLADGTGLFPNQFIGLPTLPVKLEPTDSFLMAFDPAQLANTLGKRPASDIRKACCTDGAERIYQRKLISKERQEIAGALGTANAA